MIFQAEHNLKCGPHLLIDGGIPCEVIHVEQEGFVVRFEAEDNHGFNAPFTTTLGSPFSGFVHRDFSWLFSPVAA